jgi:phage baseplate assembly protein W
MNYYRTPLLFSRLFGNSGKELLRCSEEESIDRNIELIITTYPGEHSYDPAFGCGIWELDFENVVSELKWEKTFVEYIYAAVSRYEPRIREIKPCVEFHDIRNRHEVSGAVSIRKRVDISMDAVITDSGKKCRFSYSLYLGPLSSE